VTVLPLISIVDDDESVREALQGLIRSVGYAVKVFASSEEFLSSEHLHQTDCLILDVRMPGMRGPELQRWLQANGQKIPIVFITAHGEDREVRSRALRDGAVDYLHKPLSEETVLNAIEQALHTKLS
jgi:FixJ family two-component response regulator